MVSKKIGSVEGTEDNLPFHAKHLVNSSTEVKLQQTKLRRDLSRARHDTPPIPDLRRTFSHQGKRIVDLVSGSETAL